MYQFGISGMGRNGFMNQIMTSQAAADEIIHLTCRAWDQGIDPNEYIQTLDFSNVMEDDLKRIKREVEAYVRK